MSRALGKSDRFSSKAAWWLGARRVRRRPVLANPAQSDVDEADNGQPQNGKPADGRGGSLSVRDQAECERHEPSGEQRATEPPLIERDTYVKRHACKDQCFSHVPTIGKCALSLDSDGQHSVSCRFSSKAQLPRARTVSLSEMYQGPLLRRARVLVALAGGAVALMVAGAPAPAQAFVYFTYGDDRWGGGIGRAANDGSNVEIEIVDRIRAERVTGPASDGRHVYWLNLDRNTIGRANLDGSRAKPNFLAVAPPPGGPPNSASGGFGQLAISDGWIYFLLNGSLGRVAKDGSQLTPRLLDGYADAMAVGEGRLYWSYTAAGGRLTSQNYIGRANLDGSDIDSTFIGPLEDPYVIRGLAVESDHIYWSLYRLGRAKLDGSGVDPAFIDTEGDADGALAARAGALFWSTSDFSSATGTSAFVARADIESRAVDSDFVYPEGRFPVNGVAIDSRSSPETKITRRPPHRVRRQLVTFEFRSDRASARFECAIDDRRFRRCRSPATVRASAGPHRFRVRSITVSGPDPTPASVRWRVRPRPRDR